MRLRCISWTVLSLMFVVSSASAQHNVIERAGPWQAFVTIGNQGGVICGISQFANGLRFMIKWEPDRALLYLQLSNRVWSVPQGTSIPVSLDVDGQRIWSGILYGTPMGHLIEGEFGSVESGTRTIVAFAYGIMMRVVFHEGTEGSWRVPLTGTLRVTTAFVRCMQTVTPQRAPTQPFNPSPAPPPTQPFSPRGPSHRT